MEQPKISIIIPVFNTGKSVTGLTQRLLKEKCTNLEIILIDDGSKDDSLKILKKLAEQNSKIKVFHQENRGPSSARNLGLSKATGKYVAFIDSDDSVDSKYIDTLFKMIDSNDASIAMTNIRRYNHSRNNYDVLYKSEIIPSTKHDTKKSYILKLLLNDGRLYPVANKMFHADIIKKYKIHFNESMNFAEDLHFVLDYLKYANGKILFNEKPLYTYNISNNGTVRKTSQVWKNWQKSYNHLKHWVGKNPTKKEQKLLKLVYLRWKISYFLSLFR